MSGFYESESLPVSYKKDAKNSRKLTEFMLIFILSYKFGSDRIEALNTKGEDIMKYLKEVTIIFGITMLGEFLNYLLPFPVPSAYTDCSFFCFCFAQVHYIQKMWRKWEISSWIRCRLCLYRQV